MTGKKETEMTGEQVDASGRELIITRTIDAPRELVFRMWTEKEHLIKWWGPNGFTNTFEEISVKPGGVWKFIMHGPDGVDYPNLIVYDEVVAPEKLSYSHGDPDDPDQFKVTVTFVQDGRKTRLTMRMVFRTKEMKDKVVTEFGAIEGANQTLNKLAEHIKNLPDEYIKK